MARDVFISYARSDEAQASVLVEALREAQLTVFFSPDSISSGDNIGEILRDELNGAKAVVVIEPSDAEQGGVMRQEVTAALSRAQSGELLVIPVLVGKDRVPTLANLAQFRYLTIGNAADVAQSARLVQEAISALDNPAPGRVSPRERSSSSETIVEIIRGLLEKDLEAAPTASAYVVDLATRASATMAKENLGIESLQFLRDVLAWATRTLGTDHPSVLSARAILANLLLEQGRYAEALLLLEESLTTARQALGPDHPTTVVLTRQRNAVVHNVQRGAGHS